MGAVLIHDRCSATAMMKTFQGTHIFSFFSAVFREPFTVYIISLELQSSKAGCQKTQKTSLVPAHPSRNSMDLDEIIPGVS